MWRSDGGRALGVGACIVGVLLLGACGQHPGVHAGRAWDPIRPATEVGDDASGPVTAEEDAAARPEGGPAVSDRAEEDPEDGGRVISDVSTEGHVGPGRASDTPARTPREASPAGEPSTSTGVREARPRPGVYRYATVGNERVGVPGGGREYPRTTTITVSHGGCGYEERWDVSPQRWEQRGHCVEGDRRTLAAVTSYASFFGQSERVELRCEDEAASLDAIGPGSAWQVHCRNEETSTTSRFEVVDEARMAVGGGVVDTLHLRITSRLEGKTTGDSIAEQWIDPDTGLVVRERSETEVETPGPFGKVSYTESYTIMIESVEPERG